MSGTIRGTTRMPYPVAVFPAFGSDARYLSLELIIADKRMLQYVLVKAVWW